MKEQFTLKKKLTAALVVLACISINVHGAAVENVSPNTMTATTQLESSAAQINLDKDKFTSARGRVGEKIAVGTVLVSATDLPEGVQLVPSSKINGIYTTDITTLPAGNSETDITIYYEAKKIGKDEGTIYFMSADGNYLSEIKVSGLAIDPASPPKLTVEDADIPEFNAEVQTADEKTVTVNISGFPSSVDVKVTQNEPAFTVNTGVLYYSVSTHKLKITFFPKKAGKYEATITLSNEFITPVELKIYGTATGGDDTPVVEGDELPLTYDNPVTSIDEHFNGVTHNKPLSVSGWKNIAAIGSRAWWGYTFPEYDTENAGETVAKVTAYDSKMEAGLDEECQMLLVTPPLNLKEAASQLFTFRVMGKFMIENMTEKLSLCYLTYEDGNLMAYPIEEVVMPALPDENGEWKEFQVDLTNLQLGDVCHLGFLFTGMRGPDHSTTYFIDDVTFGSTDIPVIKTDVEEVKMNTVEGEKVVSPDVTVTTMALTDDVHISLEGKYKDDFDLSCTTLPKEGGKFNMSYESSYTDGYYGVYAVLSSKGAVTKKVAFFATITSGIQAVEITDDTVIRVFTLDGTEITSERGTSAISAVSNLPQGTYILKIKQGNATRTIKIMR